ADADGKPQHQPRGGKAGGLTPAAYARLRAAPRFGAAFLRARAVVLRLRDALAVGVSAARDLSPRLRFKAAIRSMTLSPRDSMDSSGSMCSPLSFAAITSRRRAS